MHRVLVVALLLRASLVFAQWVDDCGLEPPGSVPVVPVPTRSWEPRVSATDAPIVSRVIDANQSPGFGGYPTTNVTATGALSGKTVYLSPGHGFTWTSLGSSFEWRTQRPTTNQIVEDLVSTETLNQYLIPMLIGAGAHVVSVREADLNSNLVIVDNGEAGYTEQGTATFQNSTRPGWGRSALPMSGDVLPFTVGSNRLMSSASTVTGTVTYTAVIPADGYYNVAISYSAFSTRVTDAHYVVHHAGGATHFRVNQQRHGATWELLGRFYFHAGSTTVEVLNDSASGPNTYLSLDAIRFGGGTGLITRTGTATGVSGRPRFEESARYHAQFAGAPLEVFAPTDNTPGADRTNDIGTRSRFAAWVHEPGEDAIYVAWHTNAFDGTAVGTTTYVYGPNPPDGSYNFTGVAGSDVLAKAVHAELVSDIKAPSGWNSPSWKDRGVDSANFGELNPMNNSETPAILVEVAFHDAPSDSAQLKEPDFRLLAARAITQGIIKYFAKKDGVAAKLPPEPPTRVSVTNQSSGNALLRWATGATDGDGVRGQAATSFRVYSSNDGLGWDNGVAVTGTSTMVQVPAGAPKYFRVTGVNDGGESFPSTVVGVKAPVPGRPLVLVVNSFDRLEAATAPFETFEARYALGQVERVLVLRMNDGSQVRLHGDAFDANQFGFDSADADAFEAGDVQLNAYGLIDWFAGRGRVKGAGPSVGMQGLLQGFGATRPVFFSGNAQATANFVNSLFSGAFSASSGTRLVSGAGPLTGLSALALSDGFSGLADVGLPPAVDPVAPAISLGTYDTASGAAIGVAAHSVYFAFPFEGLVDRPQRVDVLKRVIDFLLPDSGTVIVDAGIDAGQGDAGVFEDAGTTSDAGSIDAGSVDAGTVDAGTADAGTVDAGASDAGQRSDAGTHEGADAGVQRQPLLAFTGGGCTTSGPSDHAWLALGASLLALWRTRKPSFAAKKMRAFDCRRHRG